MFLPCLPQNSSLIVVDAKDRTKQLLYKSNVVNPNDSPVNNVCRLLFNNHYYPLTAWYGQHHYCIECEVRYNSKHTCKPVIICSKFSEKNCHPLPIFTICCKKCFGSFHNSTCFRNHLSNGVCDNSKSCATCAQWFIGPVFDHVCNLFYCSHYSKSVKPDYQGFIEVKIVKSWRYGFYDFGCAQNTIGTERKRPVHEVNYCITMSICDKCPDDGSCDDCLPVHSFSGLGGQNALENFCKWTFDHSVNEGPVFIAHNSSTYDAHFILSYLITNVEYPGIMVNGGKLLEIKIKTGNARLIDSCCFIAMPLSRFSDTFNLPHTKGIFPYMFNVSDNYNDVGPMPVILCSQWEERTVTYPTDRMA